MAKLSLVAAKKKRALTQKSAKKRQKHVELLFFHQVDLNLR